MEIITTVQGGGKTEMLIKMCAEKGGQIACASDAQAEAIFERAKRLGLNIPMPMTHDEFLKGRLPPDNGGYFIDDLDLLFVKLGRGRRVEVATMTVQRQPRGGEHVKRSIRVGKDRG